jgi:hypothetical protein
MRLKDFNKAMSAMESVVNLKKPKRKQGGYDEKFDEGAVDDGMVMLLTGEVRFCPRHNTKHTLTDHHIVPRS